jgi:subtilisin family serine protease
MSRFDRGRVARFVLTTSAATAAVVTGLAGSAMAGTPAALPTAAVLRATGAQAISDSYIVVLKPGSSASSKNLTQRYGGQVKTNYSATVHGFQAHMSAYEASHLAANADVAFVEQDAKVSIAATETNATWGLDRIDQRALPLSKSYTYATASNVTAYVLDTGIRISNTEFGGRARNGYDFIDKDATAQDCNGHGTHVAGTIGGSTYGVAKDVKLVAVRVLDCGGSGSYSAIIAGIDWVTKNAVKPAVANMSIGGSLSPALNAAVTRSIASGVTYAVAAGNDNTNACNQSPAATPDAITVGATDASDNRASFSNYGKCVDVFAPGVQITSSYNKSDTSAAVMSGTSMASPHVAGAAALVLGAHPAWTAAQVRDSLVTNATPDKVKSPGTGSPNKLLYTGFLDSTVTPPASTATCAPIGNGANVTIKKKATAVSKDSVTGCTGTASSSSTVIVAVKNATRGSLALSLVSPAGAKYALKAAKKADKVKGMTATYTVDLGSEPRDGAWTLRVTDTYGSTGYLDGWTLKI